MPALTRRRANDPHREIWRVYCDGDVCIGSISQRAGVPLSVDQWQWTVALYPLSHRGIREDGTAPDLFKARAAFAAAWARIEPQVTDDDLAEHRRERAWTAWKYRMADCGCRLPTQMASGQSTCFCGASIDVASMGRHVSSAHLAMR
jgi:hypothetical protein